MESNPHAQPMPRALGAYRLHEQVATGGSSTLWRGSAPSGEIVAVKLLDRMAVATPAERRRFLRGFRIASLLSHPGIARLIDAGEHDGRLFLVEEFIEGETLAERLRAGALPIEEALRILRRCAETLRYAHQSGVVHRDLSTRNLMIDRTGRVVLVDFGIAVRPDGTTQSGTNSLVGTLNYLAPELIRGRAASARSDLYALGAIAYQMLAGTPPFVASQPEALIRMHLKTRPTSLRTLRPEVDPRVDRVVQKLLAKAPEARFGNAEEVLRALDEASLPRRHRGPAQGPRRIPAREPRAIRRLAIAPFTADLDDGTEPERAARVALGLAETVAAGLSGVDGLLVVPPSQMPRAPRSTMSEQVEAAGVDAVLGAHLAQRGDDHRLAWTLVGGEGIVIGGGRLGGPGDSLFALEDALLAEMIRILRRPRAGGRLRSPAMREDWYGPFLEALGCLQRTDSGASVDRSIALLEGIRDSGAGGVQVHAALGRAYLRRGEVLRDPQWRQRAEASCRIAISLDPLAPEAMLTMGRLLVSSGRADEGRMILERALELDPGNVDATIWLSRAHEMCGELAKAQLLAREACERRPELWWVHDRKAVLDFRQGVYADAADSWIRVLDLTPDNAGAHAKLGACRFEQGWLAESEEAYRASIEIARTPLGLSGLGSVQFYQRRYDEALHWFREAVRLAPDHFYSWGNLADAQRWIPAEKRHSDESFDRAIELVRRDLAMNPEDGRCWGQLALFLAKRGQHAEAHAALTRALDHGCIAAETRIGAVLVHELAGHRDEAIAMLETIARTGIPFQLRVDPELDELRAAPEAQPLFKHPPNAEEEPHPNPRSDESWPLQPFPSA